jgi:hypothetical protein
MRWWVLAILLTVAWTAVLAVGVLAVGIPADAFLPPAAAAKAGEFVGTWIVLVWPAGTAAVWVGAYLRQDRPPE